MLFKHSLVATSVIVAIGLAGCGSDSSSHDDKPPVTPPPVESELQGQFIDAAVEGLFYQSKPSGKSGFTDAEGNYDYEQGDTITFFLGGADGLRIGSSSARAITSPFEVAGTYNKALNLARILQSMDDASNGAITLPDSVKSPSASMIAALNNVLLHDLESAEDLKSELEIADWVTEQEALEHLNESLKDLERGSQEILADWQRGSGKYLRSVDSTIAAQNRNDVNEHLFVHADKLLDTDVFNATRGMPNMTFRLDDSVLTMLRDSNDTKVSGDNAKYYLTCLDQQGVDANFVSSAESITGIAQCNDADMLGFDSVFDLGSRYDYSLLSPASASADDEAITWDEAKRFGVLYECLADQNCSEAKLTGFSITEYDDSDDQDGSGMQEDTLSTSYDPTTGVYTEVKKRTVTSGVYDGRMSEHLSFVYLVDSPESERYVDFKGTWQAVATRQGCDVVARSTYVFDDEGVTVTGEEFYSGCEKEEIIATAIYEYLAEMDYWWFTTNGEGNDSKATLTQLNSTIRWCDKDEGDNAEGCNDNDIKFNRWEYAPAGSNWDQGVLNRRTLNSDGTVRSTISMQKI